MKGTDRFLVIVVAGVILIVIAAFVVAFVTSNRPSYQPQDSPEGVANNYLLALQLQEYDRAYSCLSPALPGYPEGVEAFERDVEDHRWEFDYYDNTVSLAIEAVDVDGDRATIIVRRTTFRQGGLFDSGQSSTIFEVELRQEGGAWKVIDATRYWATCWESPRGCD